MKKKLLHNHQYHIVPRSFEELETLIKVLQQKGYKIHHGLDNISSLERLPIGICIDNGIDLCNGGKCVFQTNVTCMACYCTYSKKRPLRVEDILNNLDKLIDNPDIKFYNELLDKRTTTEEERINRL